MAHEFSETDQRCIHCGTWSGNPQRTICPRQAPVSTALRPIPASIVNDDLSERLAELRVEREAAWNTVKEE